MASWQRRRQINRKFLDLTDRRPKPKQNIGSETFNVKTQNCICWVRVDFLKIMMDLLEKDEFLKTYRSVSGQLKRKFVRKPNLSEGVEAYGKKRTKTFIYSISLAIFRLCFYRGFGTAASRCRLSTWNLLDPIQLYQIKSTSSPVMMLLLVAVMIPLLHG